MSAERPSVGEVSWLWSWLAQPATQRLDVERLMREFDAIADGIDELQDDYRGDPRITRIASRARDCYRILYSLSEESKS